MNSNYDVNEVYAEFSFPLLESLDLSAAVRWSDYSTFGSETTGKAGFRWQPIEAIAFRGTYSTGFRAPNLGELFGLTQFAATLVDPCGPTGTVVVNAADGLDTTPTETACRAQGVPNGFQQANTQITTFTGGNSELSPETSDSYTVGMVHDATWAEGFADRLTFELTYYNYQIDSGIQARDIQALLNACLAAGGTDPTLCSPFTRQALGNLEPPNNFLDNLGTLETDGFDFKIDWRGNELSWGRVERGLAVDLRERLHRHRHRRHRLAAHRRHRSERQRDSGTAGQSAARLGKGRLGSELRHALHRRGGRVLRQCADHGGSGLRPGCRIFHTLDSTIYNDVQVAWTQAFGEENFKLALTVNNIFGEDPPICYTCSLNGYDAGTYDLPGMFWAVTAKFGF